MRVQKMRRAVVEARVASLNVSQSQFHVLHEIMHAQRHGNGAPLSQKDLAERLGISAAAVAMMMKRMEKDGYLTRVVSEKDNRFNELHLTEKSLEILHQSRDIFDGLDVIAFQGISDGLQSFPASGSFQMSQFFVSGGQIIGVSASALDLPNQG